MTDSKKKALSELEERVRCIFSDFMARVAKFDELVSVSSRLLAEFHQNLELLRRPPLQKISQAVDSITKVHQSERLKAYVHSGCKTLHDGLQSVNKLNGCEEGFGDHLIQGKFLLHEMESLMDNVGVQVPNASTLECRDEHFGDGSLQHMVELETLFEIRKQRKEKLPSVSGVVLSYLDEFQREETESTHFLEPEISDYISMMAILYSLVKQDYTMQERILSSLNPNSSSEQLESYCLMWSLRPFINDEIMRQAWSLISEF